MQCSDIFEYIINEFNTRKIEYVILHSYEQFPYVFESDIDIAIHTSTVDGAINILENILEPTDWRIIQCWRHEFYAVDCIISNGQEFLQVDFCIHYERNGRILLDVEELVRGRKENKTFFVPDPSIEFTYILIKKVLKKEFKERSKRQLLALTKNMDESQCRETINMLSRYFGTRGAKEIFALCSDNRFDDIDFNKASATILKATSNIVQNLEYQIFEVLRKVTRIFNPTGLFVVVLGADGSGKSTITELFEKKYKNSFRNIFHYHSRVRVLNDLGKYNKNECQDVSQPHSHKRQASKFISLIKLGYYMLDYLIGNFIITKAKIKSSLVVIERYFYDYYIDNKRYNLKLSPTFIKKFGCFVKKPDVIFVFWGDSEILYQRKQEISVKEINRQIEEMRKNFGNENTTYFVNTTDNDVEDCVEFMIQTCNNILRKRFKKTNKLEA